MESNEVKLEFEFKGGVGISDAEIRAIVKNGLRNLISSEYWINIEGILTSLDKALTYGNSAEKLGREIRQFAVQGTEINPKYLKKLEDIYDNWLYVAKEFGIKDNEFVRPLERQIKWIRKYASERKAAPLGTKGMLDRWIRGFERNYKDISNVGMFEKIARKRLRYQALRVSRTEINRAMSKAYKMQGEKNDMVKGWRIVRSGAGMRDCDICESAAHEYMKGENMPDLPLHPQCMCHLEEIAEWNIQKEIERLKTQRETSE